MSASASGHPAIRSGSWKLILGEGSCGWSPGGDGKPIQLYNIEKDLDESENLAGEMPGKVTEMKALMEQIITNGRSSEGPKQENDMEVVRY